MTAPVKKGPGKAGYVISVVLIVVGVVGGVSSIVGGLAQVVHSVDHFKRVPIVTGSQPAQVQINDSGRYSIYYEAPGLRFHSEALGMEVAVTGPEGENVAPIFDSATDTYSFGGHHGTRIESFYANRPGSYGFRVVREPEGGVPVGAHLAIGQGYTTGFVILGIGIAGGSVLTLIGIVLLIVTAVRRSSYRKRSQPQFAAPAWGGAPGYPPQPQWGAPPPGAWPPQQPPQSQPGAWPPQQPPQSQPGAWPPQQPAQPTPGAWPPEQPPQSQPGQWPPQPPPAGPAGWVPPPEPAPPSPQPPWPPSEPPSSS